ncbi:hypothetical protein [Trueperella sp. LYQ143]|uniref:hypothetical protein n=1 Tax=unclassified Trueperella TaxID=2630174 RepID=UPI0039839D60
MRTRPWFQVIIGLLCGVVAGSAATIVHTGPIDRPLYGLALATAIVMCGAWFCMELGARWCFASYTLTAYATVAWWLYLPPRDDLFQSTQAWVSNAWIGLCVCGLLLPAAITYIAAYRRSSRVSGQRGSEPTAPSDISRSDFSSTALPSESFGACGGSTENPSQGNSSVS